MHGRAVGAAVAAVVLMAGSAWAAPAPPDPQSLAGDAAGTWGACGTWWSDTTTEISSGSVCGVDGLTVQDGQPTQLAEPLVSVSRYVCFKRRRGGCSALNYVGTVRRSEMTVDPLLHRATIRGVLGGCALDVEFAGVGPVRPGGNLAEYHGVDAGPQVTVTGGETFTSDAHWWGGVCGQTVVVNAGAGQASIFRGLAANIGNFGGRNCECA